MSERKIDAEGQRIINRRPFYLIGAIAAIGAATACHGRDEAKLQSEAAEIGGTSGKVRFLAGDISSPATGAALVESADRRFDGGLDKFDSRTRWPSFTTQGGGR